MNAFHQAKVIQELQQTSDLLKSLTANQSVPFKLCPIINTRRFAIDDLLGEVRIGKALHEYLTAADEGFDETI